MIFHPEVQESPCLLMLLIFSPRREQKDRAEPSVRVWSVYDSASDGASDGFDAHGKF